MEIGEEIEEVTFPQKTAPVEKPLTVPVPQEPVKIPEKEPVPV